MTARLRRTCSSLLLTALVAGPPAARAEDQTTAAVVVQPATQSRLGSLWFQGEVGVGGRIVWGDTDAAKWQEYRDLRDDGPIGEFSVLLEDETQLYYLRGSGVNLGYDDQRYEVEMGRYGLFELDLFWRELPNELSTDAATIYTRSGNEFVLPAGLQATLQPLAAAAQSAALGVALAGAVPTRLHLQWNEAGANTEVAVSEHLRLRSGYRLQDKQGENAYSFVFGSPGGNLVTFARPVDEKIHEIQAGADYLRDSWSLSLDYIGSLYDDDVNDVIAANPLVATDAAGAASRGRAALPPDNSAHTWSLSGSARLPVDVPNRVTGSVAYGILFQHDDFLPHTINSAIVSPGLALPADNLDGEVHTILGNLVASARPADKLSVELRGRVYNYDNTTDSLVFPNHVTTDTTLQTTPVQSVYTDYLTASSDLEASYDLAEGLTGHLGYGFDYWNRNNAREVENLWEHGPGVKLDYRPRPNWLLRTDYQFLHRSGSSYDTYSYLFQIDPDASADDAANFQSPLLRKFDEADRNRHRASVLSRVNPTENTEISFNGGVWSTNYFNSTLGRTEALGWDTGIDGAWQMNERLGLQVFYTYSDEWYSQDSRYRPVIGGVVIDDPLNDWHSKTHNWYHNGGTRVNVSLIPNVLDFETAYMASFGYEKTTASGVPGSNVGTGTDGGAAVDYPLVEAFLNAVTATLSWNVIENLTLYTQYRFEHYHLDDFRIDQLQPFMPTTNTNSRDIFLGQRIDSYTAHLIGFGARYRF